MKKNIPVHNNVQQLSDIICKALKMFYTDLNVRL